MSVASSDNSTTAEPLEAGSPEASQTASSNSSPQELTTTRSFDWVFLFLGVIVVALSFLLSRESDGVGVTVPGLFRLPSLCMTQSIFGVDCPGCGLTRSFISLAGGDFWASLQANPAGLAYFLVIAGQIPYRGWIIYRRSQGKSYKRFGHWPLYVVVAILISQWLFRSAWAVMLYYGW